MSCRFFFVKPTPFGLNQGFPGRFKKFRFRCAAWATCRTFGTAGGWIRSGRSRGFLGGGKISQKKMKLEGSWWFHWDLDMWYVHISIHILYIHINSTSYWYSPSYLCSYSNSCSYRFLSFMYLWFIHVYWILYVCMFIYIYLYTFRGRYFSVHCLFHTKNGGHNRKENKHLWEKNTSRHRVKDFIQIEISPCEFSIVKLINDLQLKRVFWLGFKPGNQKKNKSSSQIWISGLYSVPRKRRIRTQKKTYIPRNKRTNGSKGPQKKMANARISGWTPVEENSLDFWGLKSNQFLEASRIFFQEIDTPTCWLSGRGTIPRPSPAKAPAD